MMDALAGQYGYEESIFISEIPEYFHCVICTLVLKDPVQILSCGHKMCAICFERIKALSAMNSSELRCPIDRDLIDQLDVREDISSKRVIGNMVVRCYNNERGCEWTGDLRQLHTHVDQCQFKPQEQQDSETGLISSGMVNELTKRLDECESSLMHKDKEIALLKQNAQEQQQWREEMQSFKAQMSQLSCKNMELEQSQQQQQLEKLHQQQDINDLRLKNEMLERQMSELILKNNQLEQRQEKLEQQHEQHEILRHREREVSEGQQLKIGELKNEIETLRKGIATQKVPDLGDLATARLVKDKPAVIPKKEIAVELHCGSQNNVVISKDTHCVGCVHPAIVSAQMAVVPPGSKVWYEVKCTRPMRSNNNIRVGWSTSDLPFSQELDVLDGRLGDYAHGYAFVPFRACKYNNGKIDWGRIFKGNSGFVGVALDLIKGQILFSVDGEWTAPMGVAFSNIPTDVKLFPAFYGGTGTSIEYNFGDRDFTFAPPDPTFVKLLDVL